MYDRLRFHDFSIAIITGQRSCQTLTGPLSAPAETAFLSSFAGRAKQAGAHAHSACLPAAAPSAYIRELVSCLAVAGGQYDRFARCRRQSPWPTVVASSADSVGEGVAVATAVAVETAAVAEAEDEVVATRMRRSGSLSRSWAA